MATLLDRLAGTSEGKDSGPRYCAAAALFIEAEAAAVARQAGLGSDTGWILPHRRSLTGAASMSYYTSVISSSSGLPVTAGQQIAEVAWRTTRYAESGGWDDSHGAMEAPIDGGQAVYVIPSGLEMFIRSFSRCGAIFQSAPASRCKKTLTWWRKSRCLRGSAAGASEKGREDERSREESSDRESSMSTEDDWYVQGGEHDGA